MHERTLHVLVCAGVLVLIVGWLCDSDEGGIYHRKFWYDKFHAKFCADMVLAGDSRILQGLSPNEMTPILPGRKIFNYAFAAVGYSQDYLDNIPIVLERQSQTKAILLGITPWSLTLKACRSNYFEREKQRSMSGNSSLIVRFLPEMLRYLEPVSVFDSLLPAAQDKQGAYRYKVYFADGWQAADRVPTAPEIGISEYRRHFINNQVAPEIVAEVIEHVRQWRAEGIRVYGFRPPTGETVLEIERQLSKFAEETFVTQFEAAGGVWIAVNHTGYSTYDGSHLRRAAAVAFSQELAGKIRVLEGRRHQRVGNIATVPSKIH